MIRVTVKQLENFLAVAEAGNFSRASRRVHVAQPALSQAVKDLEEEIGVRLFDRTTRRVELTEAGREFQDAAAKVIGDLELALKNATDVAERRRGRIRVAAPPLLAAVVLPKTIADFNVQFPGIKIELVDAITEQIVERVRTGSVDCGLGTFPPNEDGVERTPLVQDNLMVFCGRSTLTKSKTIKWKELADHPLIALTTSSGIRFLVEIGYEAAQMALKPAYEVAHVNTALALVEAGLGISVLPTYACAAARHYDIVAKPLKEPLISREVVLIRASGRSASPAVTAFTATVRRYVQQFVPDRVPAKPAK